MFRGGTALHKLFFDTAGRFSEDLDFVQREAKPIGDTISVIRSILDPWLGQPKFKKNEGRFTLYYRFETEIEPILARKVKIEINTREHYNVLPFSEVEFQVKTSWYDNKINVITYQIEELLGTKLRALYQRKKGRDLFDFWFAFKKIPNLDPAVIVKVFQHYIAKDHTFVTAAQYEKNLALKQKDKTFNEDISILLASDIASIYDTEEAYQLLQDNIIPLMSSKKIYCFAEGIT